MKRMFTTQEKEFVFDSWKKGIGFSEIAKLLDSKPGTIFTMLRDSGGIKPPDRKRASQHLTMAEREEIRAGLSAKQSIRSIALSWAVHHPLFQEKFDVIVAVATIKL